MSHHPENLHEASLELLLDNYQLRTALIQIRELQRGPAGIDSRLTIFRIIERALTQEGDER